MSYLMLLAHSLMGTFFWMAGVVFTLSHGFRFSWGSSYQVPHPWALTAARRRLATAYRVAFGFAAVAGLGLLLRPVW